MPFTSDQLAYAGKLAMDYERKQNPEDLYNTVRPLLKALNATKQPFPGAKQYIIEKLRTKNDSNAQWFAPDEAVTYNRKRTIDQAQFPWGSVHDGFGLTEEELAQNYITMTDDRSAKPTEAEGKQFINLFKENMTTLRLGFNEFLDYQLHLDGTQDADAIPGLDALVSTTPTTGTLGGINRATAGNEFWRNNASTNIASTTGTLAEEMEKQWRLCTRVGGNAPNLILAGSKFMDAYRVQCKAEVDRHVVLANGGGGGAKGMDASVSGLFFKGVEIVWDPVFDDLQANLSVAGPNEWDKRCYFLNTRFLKLRPMAGQDMIARNPPRAYNRYTHYFAETWRGGMTITRPAAMSVMTID